MKLIVFGAAGDVGRHIVSEALARGHAVTGVHRSPRRPQGWPVEVEGLQLDVETGADLAGVIARHDLAVSALRPPDGQEEKLVSLTRLVLDAAGKAARPVLVSGGAAILSLGDGSGHTVLTAPGFLPAQVVPIAMACQAQYELCLGYHDLHWTYACPPPQLTNQPRTGLYRRGAGTLVTDANGESRIGMADFAAALLDEAENPGSPRGQFTAAY